MHHLLHTIRLFFSKEYPLLDPDACRATFAFRRGMVGCKRLAPLVEAWILIVALHIKVVVHAKGIWYANRYVSHISDYS